MFLYLFSNYCEKARLQLGIIMWCHWVQSSQTCPISLESQLISLQMQCRVIKLVIKFVLFFLPNWRSCSVSDHNTSVAIVQFTFVPLQVIECKPPWSQNFCTQNICSRDYQFTWPQWIECHRQYFSFHLWKLQRFWWYIGQFIVHFL